MCLFFSISTSIYPLIKYLVGRRICGVLSYGHAAMIEEIYLVYLLVNFGHVKDPSLLKGKTELHLYSAILIKSRQVDCFLCII